VRGASSVDAEWVDGCGADIGSLAKRRKTDWDKLVAVVLMEQKLRE
jgi:hypothetical protein